MVVLVNPINPNVDIGASINGLADALFGGSSAKNETYRQNARAEAAKAAGLERQNANVPLVADALSKGNLADAIRYGVMAGMTGDNTASYNRLGTVMRSPDVYSPEVAKAMLAAGGAFQNTPLGVSDAEDATMARTKLAADNALRIKQFEADHALVPIKTPDGRYIQVPRSQAPGLYQQGYSNPVSKDVLLGDILQRSMAPGSAGAMPDVMQRWGLNDQSAPAAPTAAPMSKDVRALIGLPTKDQPMWSRASGVGGVSEDGGQTVRLPNGRVAPVAGSDFAPVGDQALQTLSRVAGLRQNVANTAPIDTTNWRERGAAKAAYEASGPYTGVWRALSMGIDDVAWPGRIKEATGLDPRIAPVTQDAMNLLDTLKVRMQTADVLNGEGKPNVHLQTQIRDIAPDYAWYTPAFNARERVGATITQLKSIEQKLRDEINDPNRSEKDVEAAYGNWQNVRSLLQTVMSDPGQVSAPPPTNNSGAPTIRRFNPATGKIE